MKLASRPFNTCLSTNQQTTSEFNTKNRETSNFTKPYQIQFLIFIKSFEVEFNVDSNEKSSNETYF